MDLHVMMASEYDTQYFVLSEDRTFWRNTLKLQKWLRGLRKNPMPDGLIISVAVKAFTKADLKTNQDLDLEDKWIVGDLNLSEPAEAQFARLMIYRDSFELEFGDLVSTASPKRKDIMDYVKKYLPPKSNEVRAGNKSTTRVMDIDALDDDLDDDVLLE